MRYRPDIDGLRAIAVLGVVIYHAFPQNLPGGFSGVDIFFVISGYLISGILYKGHREGNFTFREFYARRVRRLFPALITMLVLSLAYGWVILLPDEFGQMGKHVAAGTLFIQNFVFWGESGYFDTAANLKPMLHLWSLAVEEQFYIIFPLLLVLIWKKPRMLLPAMVILLTVSFVLNVVMSYQAVMTDFFLTPYRAWEFLAGSLLAWWHYERGHEEEVPKWRETMSFGGALLLTTGMVLLSKQQGAYPGWRALLPVCGTCLLIEGGRGAWMNRRILSHPGLVWIGLISYPLYLFHWPILSFIHVVKGDQVPLALIWAALGLAMILAVGTYYLIEKPLRYGHSKWVVPVLCILFFATGVAGLSVWKGIVVHQPSPIIKKLLESMDDTNKDWGAASQLIWTEGNAYLNKAGGDGSITLFLGDSNIQQYGPRIFDLLSSHRPGSRGVLFLTCGGVPPIPGISCSHIPEGVAYLEKLCEIEKLPDSKIDRVVIGALWSSYFQHDTRYLYNGRSTTSPEGRREALEELGKMIKAFVGRGIQVTVLLIPPNGPELDPRCFYARDFLGGYKLSSNDLTLGQFRGRYNDLLNVLRATAESQGASVIDPAEYLSVDGICVREYPDIGPIRYDARHLRPVYVKKHVRFLDATVNP